MPRFAANLTMMFQDHAFMGLPEVLAISDRVVVLKEGRMTGVLPRTDATQERVMLAATA